MHRLSSYVLLAIIWPGCLGIWVELIKVALSSGPQSYDGVLTALATLFSALIGSSSLQPILVSTGNRDKALVSFGNFISLVAFTTAVLINVLHIMFPSVTFWASVTFAVIAVK